MLLKKSEHGISRFRCFYLCRILHSEFGIAGPNLVSQQSDRFTEKLQLVQAFNPIAYSNNHQQFYCPLHLSEVLELLQQYPSAVLMAGATDLGLEMSHDRQSFPVLISLEAVAELKQIEQTAESVAIGAAVPLSQIETKLKGMFPSLDKMLHWFAARQIRNRATLGGNIGTASPIGDLPPVLLSARCWKLCLAQNNQPVLLPDSTAVQFFQRISPDRFAVG